MDIVLSPRYVKQGNDGLRPFQRETLDAIRNFDARILLVEAPVGSGKSYFMRQLLQEASRRPLSMSKGLGYVVMEEIKVSRLDVYPVRAPVRLKGMEMTGFKGTFAVNFELPDLIGLGKSVSRGFGTVQRRGA